MDEIHIRCLSRWFIPIHPSAGVLKRLSRSWHKTEDDEKHGKFWSVVKAYFPVRLYVVNQ